MSDHFVEPILADTPVPTELTLRTDSRPTARIELRVLVDRAAIPGLDRAADAVAAQHADLSHRLETARDELVAFKHVATSIKGKFSSPPKSSQFKAWDAQLAELVNVLPEVTRWDVQVARDSQLLQRTPASYIEFANYHNALVKVVRRDAYVSVFVARFETWVKSIEHAVKALSSKSIVAKSEEALRTVLALRALIGKLWPFSGKLKVEADTSDEAN
ncbi:hypothetical protein Q8F55_001477 [Vanrija albida]|uniref:Uncharacterized protein n=1 Tax=Vanrija albida TaxID=181172 RepID=A0ABR3QG37_9TREE